MSECAITIEDYNVSSLWICILCEEISKSRTVYIRPMFKEFFSYIKTECFHHTPAHKCSAPSLCLILRIYISPVFSVVIVTCICSLIIKLRVRFLFEITNFSSCSSNKSINSFINCYRGCCRVCGGFICRSSRRFR